MPLSVSKRVNRLKSQLLINHSLFQEIWLIMLVHFLLLILGSAQETDTIPLNPATLSGLLVVLLLLVFLCMGLSALSSVDGPSVFTPTPLIIGKEK